MSSALPTPTNVPLGTDISASFDGIYYGLILATIMFGITIVQGCIYFSNNEDKWPLKSLVACLILLDISTTVIDAQIGHHYLIANFGNLMNLMNVSMEIGAEALITTIIILAVQLFFAWRVLKLRPKRYILPALIVITAVASEISFIITFVEELKDRSLASLDLPARKIEVSFDNALAFASDVFATIGLCISFFESRAGIKRTDSVLRILFLIVVTRGVLLSVVQLMTLILYVVSPDKFYWMALHLCHSKLYIITMVAMLNARPALREKMSNGGAVISSFAPASNVSQGGRTMSSATYHQQTSQGTTVELGELKNGNAYLDAASYKPIIVHQHVAVSSFEDSDMRKGSDVV